MSMATVHVSLDAVKVNGNRNAFLELQPFIYLSMLPMSICVEVLRLSQPNGVMSSAVSLPNHTFTGQA